MTRPRCCYRIDYCPKATLFKPKQSGTRKGKIVELSREEIEALRLKNVKGLDQTKGAKHMGISQSSFQRILSSAYRKISDALTTGKTIKILKIKSK